MLRRATLFCLSIAGAGALIKAILIELGILIEEYPGQSTDTLTLGVALFVWAIATDGGRDARDDR